jgi:hypothetical protein
MKECCWLALILTFSSGEKEQLVCVFGLSDDRPANPATSISGRDFPEQKIRALNP